MTCLAFSSLTAGLLQLQCFTITGDRQTLTPSWPPGLRPTRQLLFRFFFAVSYSIPAMGTTVSMRDSVPNNKERSQHN